MDPMTFDSNRSATQARKACVSSDTPFASKIGLDILQEGGNAADAAVAMAVAMGVVQPIASGIGGDCFCLFYRASDRKVLGLNGSGHSSAGVTLEKVRSLGFSPNNPIPRSHGLSVNVPGAVAGMEDCVSRFGSGKFTFGDLISPSIKLAEEGFPVPEINAFAWNKNSDVLRQTRHGSDLLIDNHGPKAGEVVKFPSLAQSLKEIATHGKAGFYTGRIAEKIVDEVQHAGGTLTLEDLKYHMDSVNSDMEPVSVVYQGKRLWELPPNSQGMIALMALAILQDFDLKGMGHNSTDYIHTVSEALRISFADAFRYIGDPDFAPVPMNLLLSSEYARKRGNMISPDTILGEYGMSRLPPIGSDTTYLSVVDKDRNACSFITSVTSSFGSGLVPEGCGFVLQDRGHHFNLDEGHPNVIGPRKRSIHTIIPAILTDPKDESLLASFGVMGRWMQPQGHVQVLLNMLEFGMNPQKALDRPRFCVGKWSTFAEFGDTLATLSVEEGIPTKVLDELRSRGHKVDGPKRGIERSPFGRGHVIARGELFGKGWKYQESKECLWGGADPRCDSLVLGY